MVLIDHEIVSVWFPVDKQVEDCPFNLGWVVTDVSRFNYWYLSKNELYLDWYVLEKPFGCRLFTTRRLNTNSSSLQLVVFLPPFYVTMIEEEICSSYMEGFFKLKLLALKADPARLSTVQKSSLNKTHISSILYMSLHAKIGNDQFTTVPLYWLILLL